MDVYGQALSDHYRNTFDEPLWLNNSYGEPEEMPVEVFFRSPEEMPELETVALRLCQGRVLDIGAGVGGHSLLLQQKSETVALEISPTACSIMRERGVKNVQNLDFFKLARGRFDTLLLLMNGLGLAGTLDGLRLFLDHCKSLINANGTIIFDSSDISYLYDDVPHPQHYFGEIRYQYQYKGKKGEWFNWLYVDKQTLALIAIENGWDFKLLFEDENDQYLGQLSLRRQ